MLNRRVTAVLLVLSWSPVVLAHGISWQIAALFVGGPLAGIVLSIVLGAIHRSWLYGLGSFALVGLWVSWFWVASAHTTSDLLVWIPIYGLGAHVLALLVLIARRIVLKFRGV